MRKKEPFVPAVMTKAAFTLEELQPGYVAPEARDEKRRLEIRVSKKDFETLKRISERDRMPVATLIRMILARFCDERALR